MLGTYSCLRMPRLGPPSCGHNLPVQKLLVHCPAKLNLFLAVGPRDSRGYHPIRTIFQAVGLWDRLHVQVGGEFDRVEFDQAGIPSDNTITKAIRLMREYAELPGLTVRVEKVIPSQAGLGGGSSDGAGIIRAVRKLYPERLSESDAATVAAAVGADVPFFLVGGKARGEGYGEVLTPLPDETEPVWALIVMPPYAYSTPDMFARLDTIEYPFREFPAEPEQYNDFERVLPYGGDPMNRMGAFGGRHCGLTGSGSAQYALFDDLESAQRAMGYVEAEDLGDCSIAPFLTRNESMKLEVLSG